ncbi:MAG TPA: DUF4296 domain-containing protein [Ohtaekwangia sp.]|uniref:DUF4296 domain-containing protein n=1 Tax=Ohtaekwangia sp. TaxID=2066019 RepID=UPI002F92A12F
MAAALLLIVTGMWSCATKESKPEGILPPDVMSNTIAEVLLAEEKVNHLHLTNDSAKKVFAVMRGKVFQKTGVPDSVFDRSMNYYIDHPKELEQIYTALVDSLNLKEQRASVRPAEK